jgi:hypothetical protein
MTAFLSKAEVCPPLLVGAAMCSACLRGVAPFRARVREAERFGSRQVDNEIELGRLFDGDVARLQGRTVRQCHQPLV